MRRGTLPQALSIYDLVLKPEQNGNTVIIASAKTMSTDPEF